MEPNVLQTIWSRGRIWLVATGRFVWHWRREPVTKAHIGDVGGKGNGKPNSIIYLDWASLGNSWGSRKISEEVWLAGFCHPRERVAKEKGQQKRTSLDQCSARRVWSTFINEWLPVWSLFRHLQKPRCMQYARFSGHVDGWYRATLIHYYCTAFAEDEILSQLDVRGATEIHSKSWWKSGCGQNQLRVPVHLVIYNRCPNLTTM